MVPRLLARLPAAEVAGGINLPRRSDSFLQGGLAEISIYTSVYVHATVASWKLAESADVPKPGKLAPLPKLPAPYMAKNPGGDFGRLRQNPRKTPNFDELPRRR